MTALFPSAPFAAQAEMVGRKRRVATGAAVVLALHLALLWLATRPAPAPLTIDHRVWIQLLPLAPATTASKRLPAKTATAPARPSSRTAGAPPSAVTPAAPPAGKQADAAATAAVPAEQTPYVDPLALAPDQPAPPPDMLQLALKAAGAIDRELRAGERQLITAPLDTRQARLARGFAEARAAVKPKWYEAAQIELFSAPNDPKRIYRITTAFGEYCLYYPDKASSAVNSSAAAGHASFGQPRMASCPTRF